MHLNQHSTYAQKNNLLRKRSFATLLPQCAGLPSLIQQIPTAYFHSPLSVQQPQRAVTAPSLGAVFQEALGREARNGDHGPIPEHGRGRKARRHGRHAHALVRGRHLRREHRGGAVIHPRCHETCQSCGELPRPKTSAGVATADDDRLY